MIFCHNCIFQNAFGLSVTSATIPFPLVGVGAHTDQDSLSALWENGEKLFNSDLLAMSDLTSASATNTTFLNISQLDLPSVVVTNNQTSSVMFCQSPITSSYCVDYGSLTLAMSKVGESFMADVLQSAFPTQMISSHSCIQFCANKNAKVCSLFCNI